MDDIKDFKKTELLIVQNLVGLRLQNIFKQLDMFVLNFGSEIKYALHTFSFLRIRKDNELIMTSTDEYLFPNNTMMPRETYENDEMHTQSLLSLTLQKTKELVKAAEVNKVEVSETADIFITFDNNVVIETFTDSLWQNNEFYRFFKYSDYKMPHYVVRYFNKKIVLEKVHVDDEFLKTINFKNLSKLKEKLKMEDA